MSILPLGLSRDFSYAAMPFLKYAKIINQVYSVKLNEIFGIGPVRHDLLPGQVNDPGNIRGSHVTLTVGNTAIGPGHLKRASGLQYTSSVSPFSDRHIYNAIASALKRFSRSAYGAKNSISLQQRPTYNSYAPE